MRELLTLLPKPGRYTGNEEGAVHKDPDAVGLRVALAFPDMYEVGMSYLGQTILYSLINEQPDWWAERVFTPCREAGEILRTHKAPLCSLESDTPLTRFDTVGFSVTHELCYTNILYMLDLAGIPARSKDRHAPQADGRLWPLIVAGGGCVLAAEPIAPFVDIMFLGEAEESFPEFLEILAESREAGRSREDVLLAASRIPGVYVPEFFAETPEGLRPLHEHHARPTRRIVADMNDAPYPVRRPVAFGAVHNRLALEIGRGCTRGCRFCQAGVIYRPARERSVPELEHLLETCLTGTGFDDVSFLSLSSGDFSALKELFMNTVDRCAAEQISVSLPSLRVGSIDDAIMERMAGIRRTGATLAPEAGTERLRRVINKGVTEEDLILHVQKLFEHGWRQVKLYFMIGLPSETDEDLMGIVDLCRKARDAAGPGIKSMQITASISPFVPKPHTPFQWEPQISLEEMRRRVTLLLDAFKKEKRLKLKWHEPDMSLLEGVFSRGDRRLAPVVERAYQKGAVFSSWMEGFDLAPWLEALREEELEVEEYTAGRDLDAALPWDHLSAGVGRDYLLRERDNAFKDKTTPDCRYGACSACGICDGKPGPSLLERPAHMSSERRYRSILNKPQRDQESHRVELDQYGRVKIRRAEVDSSGFPPPPPEHLTVKAQRLLVHYERKGPAVFLSQLEIQHIFDRALRRAGLAPTFSRGYHPLPLLSFGRALSVGVGSEDEWFSITLREKTNLTTALPALNKGLPGGLRVTRLEDVPVDAKLTDVAREVYEVRCVAPEGEEVACAEFLAAWKKVEEASALPFVRETKKGLRSMNLRSFIAGIAEVDETTVRLELDWSAGYLSPPVLCRAALSEAGFECAPHRLLIVKKTASEA